MSIKRRLLTNVPGSLYVNSACINCDTCRQLAPEIFTEEGGYSAVTKQPDGLAEARQAFHALLACPTAAIVSEKKDGVADAMNDFPLLLEEQVYYCGYTSVKSYGGSSYFIARPEGNWLIDSPRFFPALVNKFNDMGGIDTIFLTHRDDVADAHLYAERFGAKRIIHIDERSSQPDAEHFIEGIATVDWLPDFRILIMPGHTIGHMMLLYMERYLFTGDHLAWDRDLRGLDANRDYCWYSWSEQIKSMERLANEEFAWILPGHGERILLEKATMKQEMQRLLHNMKNSV